MYVLWTDDDCFVDRNWIRATVRALRSEVNPTIVFGNVHPAPGALGYTPSSVSGHDIIATSVWNLDAPDGVNIGIGVSMAVRRLAVLSLGGFDEMLGPGATFHNADDTDVVLRALMAGHTIVHLQSIRVRHYGDRTPDEFRRSTQETMFSVGVVGAKLLRWKPIPALGYLAGVYWRLVLKPLGIDLACFRLTSRAWSTRQSLPRDRTWTPPARRSDFALPRRPVDQGGTSRSGSSGFEWRWPLVGRAVQRRHSPDPAQDVAAHCWLQPFATQR